MSGSAQASLRDEVVRARDAALAAIAEATDSASLRKCAADLASKKSTLNAVRAKLGKITDAAEKKLVGQALSEIGRAHV